MDLSRDMPLRNAIRGLLDSILVLLLICLVSNLVGCNPFFEESPNYLRNPSADDGFYAWKTYGDMRLAQASGDPCFESQFGGYAYQDVDISQLEGSWLLLVGMTSSERVGDFTGLGYLYGYFLNAISPNQIEGYIEGQNLRSSASAPFDWVLVYGMFNIPAETGSIRVLLNVAERQDVPHNGSRTWFDDIGVYIYRSRSEAESALNGML